MRGRVRHEENNGESKRKGEEERGRDMERRTDRQT